MHGATAWAGSRSSSLVKPEYALRLCQLSVDALQNPYPGVKYFGPVVLAKTHLIDESTQVVLRLRELR
jgi:hypothetical protein